jgi:hypothetical protein
MLLHTQIQIDEKLYEKIKDKIHESLRFRILQQIRNIQLGALYCNIDWEKEIITIEELPLNKLLISLNLEV